MDEQKTKSYMDMQMEELKATHTVDDKKEVSTLKKEMKKQNAKNYNAKNAEIAKMYDDAAEYEEDLKGFEEELEIVNNNKLKDIAEALILAFPEEERDYAQELRTILETGWTDFVEVEKTHPKEQLTLIKETEFANVVEKLNAAYPEYTADFELDIRGFLVKRWENLITIKKEHIKQELDEIKTTGLKPKYVKRVYEQFHGLC